MKSIAELKDQEQTDCPLLLFECALASGQIERWCTHTVTAGGQQYEPRILRHSDFELRSGTVDGIDGTGRISVVLANADGRLSELEAGGGLKGARLTVRFVFFDLEAGVPTSETSVVFLGVANPPDEITEETFRLTFSNRMSLQRLLLPDVRIQRRCPWIFPTTAEQRAEAADGGQHGSYSPFYRCGYSADIPGGCGRLDSGTPFTTCNYTRADCEARGMFGDPARRFGGIEYLPSAIDVRSYGARESHASAPVENAARYEDFVPLVYGTAWWAPVIVFARSDGNLTRMEVLLGAGRMQGVLKLLVNDIEVPEGVAGRDMTATGWFNMATQGDRTGAFDPNFPEGDPYGSMAVLSIAVPSRIADGTAVPHIRVLAQGKLLERFDTAGTSLGETFTNNPAWIILDVLRRAGWTTEEIDIVSFASTAAYCDERILAVDSLGNETTTPRYQCNLALTKRRSAGDVVRGIRAGSGLYLCFGGNGLLRLRVESSLAVQQPTKAPTSNSTEALANGWPAYRFGDGTHGDGGILCSPSGAPLIRFWSRSSAETPNRLSIEFQDEHNEYQQDSLSLLDTDDYLVTRQEVDTGVTALGIPNFSQALRLLRRQLNRSVRGNRYVTFETSVKGIGLMPGDLITLTYAREALDRQLFRVLNLSPGTNYRTMTITAQLHDDSWYEDNTAATSRSWRQPSSTTGLPKPLTNAIQLREVSTIDANGAVRLTLSVEFLAPTTASSSMAGIPLIALSPTIDTEGGMVASGAALYYAVTGVTAEGAESALSFTVVAHTPMSSENNRIILTGLSFPRDASTFNVYRGVNPWIMARVAEHVPLSLTFEDSGLPAGTAPPPDNNYDHTNIYWRTRTRPESAVTSATTRSITCSQLSSTTDALRGMILRISAGPGAGQERQIISNTEQTIELSQPWTVLPTVESRFTVSESGWRYGASSSGPFAAFDIPNEPGRILEVSLRTANLGDRESAYELSPLIEWTIGGSGDEDRDVAGAPQFDLTPIGRRLVELSNVHFDTLANTRSIQAGTLGLHFRDDLDANTPARLSAAVNADDGILTVSAPRPVLVNDLLQIDGEIVRIDEIDALSGLYHVSRGLYGTESAAHDEAATLIQLKRKIVTVGFPKGFFGSLSASSYSTSIDLSSATLVAATFYVTNNQGNSPTSWKTFLTQAGGGLRTYGGGQLCLQVAGPLAIENNATPPLIIQEATSVRDVFASVTAPSSTGDIVVQIVLNDALYCTVTIPAGATTSASLPGEQLAPLPTKGTLGLNITSVPQSSGASPGRDLTVTIRV